MTASLIVSGPRACFTDPLRPAERTSYRVITPSAAVGVLEGIYWHPPMKWVVDGITVLNPIKILTEKYNELGGVKNGQPRLTTMLTDVAYRIDAHFEENLTSDGTRRYDPAESGVYNKDKIEAIFRERLAKGRSYRSLYLGLKEHEAFARPATDDDVSVFAGTGIIELGPMLYSPYDFDGELHPMYYQPTMVDGFIDVAAARRNGEVRYGVA